MLHLIVNSASKKSEAVLAEAEQLLKKRGVPYDVFRSSAAGDVARETARLTSAGPCTVVAVGGDGTLNEALSGIRDFQNTAFGLLPAGTGNDFAARAKIPCGAAALGLILDTQPKDTDFIDCGGGKRCANIAGLGIDTDILDRVERKKREGKKCSYFKSLLVSLLKYRPVRMRVTADGTAREFRVLIAAVCNGSMFGGGIPICPDADLSDGLADLVAVDCPKRILFPFYLIKLMRGKLQTCKIYHRIRCREAEIVPEGTDTVQLDGEILPATSLRTKVVSGALRMYRG